MRLPVDIVLNEVLCVKEALHQFDIFLGKCSIVSKKGLITPVEHSPLMVRFILLGNSHTAQYLEHI